MEVSMSNTKTNLTRSDEEITEIIKLVARFLFTTVLMLGVLFLSAGRFDWWEAWVYVAMTIILLICSRIILLIKYPDLAKEEMEIIFKQKATERWIRAAKERKVRIFYIKPFMKSDC